METKIPFIKMHGTGNDFVIIDARYNNYPNLDYKKIANRKIGIGCDQAIIINHSTKADCMMKVFNADGSSAEMCGNAARCVVKLIISEKDSNYATIELVGHRIISGERLNNGQVRVNMGKPSLDWNKIPLSTPCDTLNLPIELGPLIKPVGVSMGNPHAVFFADDISSIPFEELASKLEKHSLFPNGANISIAQITKKQINMKVWERGVGITDSCGSAACAALVAAVRRGYIDVNKEVIIRLPGGDLFVELNEDYEVFMSGEVAYVFYGELILK
ncbi:diaminopimelate epimerase [Candidatus Mesenet endosymbiont of Agriotes lineatus]|uniref:diaminopimelate epimerase n=1 Tax=Candidatus Mesenet endosymbiont of Agriotes lineatus TaxID=3077948 RepID=UPI0030CEF614